MMRVILSILFAILLSILETSFFGSLPGVVRFTPFVFVVSVYLLQHHSVRSAIWWMMIHGLLIDFFGAFTTPLVTLAYAASAWVAYTTAEKLFSNRSFYGVVACASLSYVTFFVVSGALRWMEAIFQKQPLHPTIFLADSFRQILMMFVGLTLLFSFAKQIRHLLVRLRLLPESRQTY